MPETIMLQDHKFEEWVTFFRDICGREVLINNCTCYDNYYDEERGTLNKANSLEININYDSIVFIFDAETGKFIKFV